MMKYILSMSIEMKIRKQGNICSGLKTNKGLTLIETVIYLSLYSLIMGSVIVVAYQMFEAGSRSQTRAMVMAEGDFIVAKINWVLSGVQAITSPQETAGTCSASTTLRLSKLDSSIGEMKIDNSLDGNMQITRESLANIPLRLNSSNSKISELEFTRCMDEEIGAEWIETEFQITAVAPNGDDVVQRFHSRSYIWK
jgi:hypothetical protein